MGDYANDALARHMRGMRYNPNYVPKVRPKVVPCGTCERMFPDEFALGQHQKNKPCPNPTTTEPEEPSDDI